MLVRQQNNSVKVLSKLWICVSKWLHQNRFIIFIITLGARLGFSHFSKRFNMEQYLMQSKGLFTQNTSLSLKMRDAVLRNGFNKSTAPESTMLLSNKTICYCIQKLTMLSPPPVYFDWPTVLELTLKNATMCRSCNLTKHLKNIALMCKTWAQFVIHIHLAHFSLEKQWEGSVL